MLAGVMKCSGRTPRVWSASAGLGCRSFSTYLAEITVKPLRGLMYVGVENGVL